VYTPSLKQKRISYIRPVHYFLYKKFRNFLELFNPRTDII
jgi:hypothetical protein